MEQGGSYVEMNENLLGAAEEPSVGSRYSDGRVRKRKATGATYYGHHPHLTEDEKKKLGEMESLDYVRPESVLNRESNEKLTAEERTSDNVRRWLVALSIGMATGMTAFLVHLMVEVVQGSKLDRAQELVEEGDKFASWVFYTSVNVLLVCSGSYVITFLVPAAAGSGIPEVKGYLNGTRIPKVMNVRTLLAKIFGVITSVAASLPVGPEGPMIHAGAMIGGGLSQARSRTLNFALPFLARFRNDHDRRDFVAGGAAAGVAAAFGAPVGGVLFAIEEAASFWSHRLTWRTFFGTAAATFTTNFFLSGTSETGRWGEFDDRAAIIFNVGESSFYKLYELPAMLVLALVGGLAGALFTAINTRIGRFRRDRLNKWRYARVVEVLLITLLYSTFAFTLPLGYSCQDNLVEQVETLSEGKKTVQWDCPDGQYNEMATLYFTNQESTIKHLFSRDTFNEFSLSSLFPFLITYYLFAVWTAGSAISSGLVVPMMTIGAAYGRIWGHILKRWFPDSDVDPGVYALIGAASFMGGVMRMTISLSVIVLEITNDLRFLLPIMLTITISKWIADYFTHPLYDLLLEMKHIPFLEPEPNHEMTEMTARDVAASPVVCVREEETVRTLLAMLRSNTHNGFPVVSATHLAGEGAHDDGASDGVIVGLIRRADLTMLLHMRVFKGKEVHFTGEQWTHMLYNKRPPPVERMAFVEEELDQVIDLLSYMDNSPMVVSAACTTAQAFRLFRSFGLRHLPVIDRHNRVVGIITRMDLIEPVVEEHYERLQAAKHADGAHALVTHTPYEP